MDRETKITDIDGGRKRLVVGVPWDEVAADYDELLAEYRKLDVPGFRPGKAPVAVIVRRFSKQLSEDFVSRCGERISRGAFHERDVTPAGPVAIVDHEIKTDESFRFTAEFLPLPEFELPPYGSIPLESDDDEERRDEISDWLLKNTALEVPAELVKDELAFGDDPQSEKGSQAWEDAEYRIRLVLILRKIAAADGVEVEDRDVEERIGEMSSAYGISASQLRGDMAQTGGMSRLRTMMLAERVLDYLLETNLGGGGSD